VSQRVLYLLVPERYMLPALPTELPGDLVSAVAAVHHHQILPRRVLEPRGKVWVDSANLKCWTRCTTPQDRSVGGLDSVRRWLLGDALPPNPTCGGAGWWTSLAGLGRKQSPTGEVAHGHVGRRSADQALEIPRRVLMLASVLTMGPSLSELMAVEASAFSIEKVPPKPEQTSAVGSSTTSMPRTPALAATAASSCSE